MGLPARSISPAVKGFCAPPWLEDVTRCTIRAFQWRWSWTRGYQEDPCECVRPLLSGSGRSTSAMGREMIRVFSPGQVWVHCCYGDQRVLSILLQQCLGLNLIRGMLRISLKGILGIWLQQTTAASYFISLVQEDLAEQAGALTSRRFPFPSHQHRLAAPLSVQEGWASTWEVSALSW